MSAATSALSYVPILLHTSPLAATRSAPTIDWETASGDAIPIEARGADEVLSIAGVTANRQRGTVAIATAGTKALNFAFDVTPQRLVTGYITERGIARDIVELRELFSNDEDHG